MLTLGNIQFIIYQGFLQADASRFLWCYLVTSKAKELQNTEFQTPQIEANSPSGQTRTIAAGFESTWPQGGPWLYWPEPCSSPWL